MAQLIQNEFASFNLTEEEALQGSILTTLQMQVIQNQLSNAAMGKNALDFDPNNSAQFIQDEETKLPVVRAILDKQTKSTKKIVAKIKNKAKLKGITQ